MKAGSSRTRQEGRVDVDYACDLEMKAGSSRTSREGRRGKAKSAYGPGRGWRHSGSRQARHPEAHIKQSKVIQPWT